MAGLGRKVWAAGEVVDNNEVQNYLQDQTILRYGTEAEANSSIGTAVASGMVRYITSTNSYQKYDGTSWSGLADLSTNYISNGDFAKVTRGVSSTNTNGGHVHDRWFLRTNDTTATYSNQTFASGAAPLSQYEFGNYARIVTTGQTANNTLTVLRQLRDDVRTLAGQKVTFSVWAKAGSGTPKFNISFTQVFGNSGTAPVETISTAQTLSTSWARYSFTVDIPSIAGKTLGTNYTGLSLSILVSAGSDYSASIGTGIQNNTFEFFGAQLEVGAVATDFKPSGGIKPLDVVSAGADSFDGVLVSVGSSTNYTSLGNGVGAGTPAWAGYDVAGKNKIINGAFDFWQRGTTFVNQLFAADRWRTAQDGSGTQTVTQQTFALGAAPVAGYEGQYFLRSTCTSAGTSTFQEIQQRVESVRTFAGQTITVSFWAKADTNRTANLYLEQNFGSGGSASVYPILGQSIALTAAWQRFTYTTSVASISGKTIGTNDYFALFIRFPTGTGVVCDIWGVQLEAGSVATPFSRAGGTIQAEKSACQRYYWRTTALGTNDAILPAGIAISSTQVIIHGYHPTSMRNFTTSFDFSNLRLYDGVSAFTVTAVASSFTNPDTYALTISCSGGLTQYRPYVVLANTGPSYFGANAEL